MWRRIVEGWVTKAALRWRGWSVRSLFLAPLAVLLAALLRMGFAYFGATLYFATFFPAVLVVGLLAGAPAGALTILLTLPVVWWAFIPPTFVFNALTPTDYVNFVLFIISGGMTVCLAELYRSTVVDLLNLQKSREHLMRELDHRVGNMLAVTQAIVTGTLSDQKSAEAVNGRLRAIARANAKVSGLTQKPASLEELLRDELWPFATSVRASLAGPALQLTGDFARHVALVIHELTTNSVKYGALSNDRGAVRVRWSIKGDQCFMFWREQDGPTVTPPAATGYGSLMINASLAAIGGSIKTEFCSDGFACEISFRAPIPVLIQNSLTSVVYHEA